MAIITPVFISYAARDRYFVNLLRALLDYEGVENWCDRERIAAGEKVQQRILDGLNTSRSLITVVSRHAAESRWLTGETSAFCSSNPDAVVIPIILDATPPAQVYAPLAAYHAIDMTEDMHQGFSELLARFGRGFLTGRGQRRGGEERRGGRDRRQHPLRRLRTGLWQSYAQVTGSGKFDQVEYRRATQRFKIAEALEPEIVRYEFYDELHKQIDSRWVLDQALESVAGNQSEDKAIYVIERLAAYVNEHYEVKSKDRRRGRDRRAAPGGDAE